MRLTISNDIKIDEPNEQIKRYCDEVLTIDNPDFLNAQKLGRYLGNIPRKMKLFVRSSETLILPYGCLNDVWKLSAGASFDLKFHPWKGNTMEGSIKLYDYQENALRSLKSGKNGILESPCGSGKTQIGLQFIKEIGGRALWLTHTGKLLEQSKARCEAFFKGDFGTITEGKVEMGKDITFATVQTMSKIDVSVYKDEFDVVVVDECHHCVGSPTKVMQFYKILTNCNARYKIGLSATLTRGDNLICCLYSIIGNVLHTITKKEVGNKIVKASHVVVRNDKQYNPYFYCDSDGTISNLKLINLLSEDEERNQLVIDNVFRCYNEGRKQIVLCHRVKQVEELSEKIGKFCNVNCITGKVSNKKRQQDGDVIVATFSLAKEGLDIPDLDTLHLVTPQKNDITTEQSVGRIERNVENKKQPICYDYVDYDISYCVNCFKKRKRILNKVK